MTAPSAFLLRAHAELERLSEGGTQCVYAGQLAKALWPNSPGWYRVSRVGYGSTVGVGPKRAAGGVLKRLIEADLAVVCFGQFHNEFKCYGYRSKEAK